MLYSRIFAIARSLSVFRFLSFVCKWIEKYTIYLCCFQCGCILRELVGFVVSKRARVCLCVRVRTHYLCTILPQSHIHVRITLQYIHTPVDTSCCLQYSTFTKIYAHESFAAASNAHTSPILPDNGNTHKIYASPYGRFYITHLLRLAIVLFVYARLCVCM